MCYGFVTVLFEARRILRSRYFEMKKGKRGPVVADSLPLCASKVHELDPFVGLYPIGKYIFDEVGPCTLRQ